MLRDVIPDCVQYAPEFLSPEEANETFSVIDDAGEWHRLVDFFDVRKEIPSTVFLDYDAATKKFMLSNGGDTAPWSEVLVEIKDRLDILLEADFRSLLINYYADGDEYLPMHTDNIVPQGKDPIVAGISLGAVRKFQFASIVGDQILSIDLEHGSLIVLYEQCQKQWRHGVPPSTVTSGPRINLTFRSMR